MNEIVRASFYENDSARIGGMWLPLLMILFVRRGLHPVLAPLVWAALVFGKCVFMLTELLLPANLRCFRPGVPVLAGPIRQLRFPLNKRLRLPWTRLCSLVCWLLLPLLVSDNV